MLNFHFMGTILMRISKVNRILKIVCLLIVYDLKNIMNSIHIFISNSGIQLYTIKTNLTDHYTVLLGIDMKIDTNKNANKVSNKEIKSINYFNLGNFLKQ